MTIITTNKAFHAMAFYFCLLYASVIIVVASVEIRDNKVHLSVSEKSPFSLLRGEFHVKELALSEGQPTAVQVGSILHCSEDGQFNFPIAAVKSKAVASWFNRQCDPSECTTFGHAAGQLYFASLGTLRIWFSYKYNATKQQQVIFDDILIAQGQSLSSNWWFGGVYCRKNDKNQVACRGSTEDEHQFSFTFLRGGNAADSIRITNINFLNWMKNIEDGKLLNQINIPGTHDSATYNYHYMKVMSSLLVKTQSLSIREQLESGIRFLDIRCRHVNDNFTIHHGPIFVNLNFDQVLQQIIAFLNENPSESVVVMIKEEHKPDGNSRAFEQTFLSYVAESTEYWYRGTTIPSLKDARKKIILIYRFTFLRQSFGINAANWKDNARFQIYRNSFTLDIQDVYNVAYEEKERSIREMVDSSRKRESRCWYLNYVSLTFLAAKATLTQTATFTNNVIHTILATERPVFLGLVIMDYPENQDGLILDIIYDNEHF